MALRNFWISAKIDGRSTALEGGPRGREDCMSIKILQRKNGEIDKNGVSIWCYEDNNERCVTVVECEGKEVLRYVTER